MVVGEASIHNIMGGMESTGGVRLHNHKRKLKQRFDIIKKLGQGTYGKVQLGINKETGQEVAIKTIKKCKIETEADLIRIRREIQIMSSVQHPNIIHIYEVFENREKMVLVMEYAAGGELYDYLSERKVLAEHEARRIFRQISTAVFYCHKHKICHRDLKLENILLDQIGNAKIADFGLSNVFDERRLLSTFCGSPLYASPEIVKGTPYHGPEVDCWSLGVLLFTLVYGAMPFDGSNFKRLVKQISQSDYFEPKKPSPASPLIKEMLTVCPTRRADVEKICAHWWVNEGYEQSCLDIAEELAAQTPVRLDLLLSLVPQSASAEKLVVGDQQAAGDTASNMSSETLVPTRCHSVGSLMELDQNNSDRRIREMVEEDPRHGAAGDAKRKLETTPSMDETAAAGVKRKERSRRKDRAADRETRQYRSGSRHHSAPIPNPITEEAMEVDPSVVVTVPTSKTIDINLLEGAAACSELIEESKEKALRDERSKTPVTMPSPGASTAESKSQETGKIVPKNELVEREVLDDRKEETSELKTGESTKKTEGTPEKKKTVRVPKTSENSSESVQNETEVSKKAAEEPTVAEGKNKQNCTTESLKNVGKPDESQSDKKPLRKLKEKAISLDSDAANEVAEPPMKPVERRRSKIFETAEKFNQMAAAAENDKPKKIFIPGVNVGGAKRAFERKASLSSITIPQTVKPSASKVIIDVAAAAKAENVQEKTELSPEENSSRIEKALSKREEEKKRAVDIISGAIGKPPMMKKLNGSPPTSPQNHNANKLGLKLQVGPNDVRNATVSVSTPTETKFPFETKPSLQAEVVPDTLEAANTSTFVSDEPKKSSKMEITLKSATLPRPRKTSKAEITLAGVKSADSPAFKSEVEAKIDAFHPQKLRTQRSEVAFPVAAAVPQANRSSSLEPENRMKNLPKERIIPIQVESERQVPQQCPLSPPPKPPMPQRSMSQRSGSLSRQSTADSDTDSAIGSTIGAEPIRKSPREYIIPIAVEGGGYVTPRSGSLEPESKTSTPTSTNPPRSRFGLPRRMSSLLSDASEDESPFSTLHRDNDDLLQRHMHRLRSSRPTRQAPEHADSLSSGEDDDDDGFELLTAENLFSTLLSRVRSLTQRLNVDDNRGTGFPSSRLLGRLGSNSPQGFWGMHEPLSRRLSESQFRRSLSRDIDGFGRKESTPGTPSSPGARSTPSRDSIFEMGSNTLPRDKSQHDNSDAEVTEIQKQAQETLEQNFTPSLARRLSRHFIEQTRQSLPRSPSMTREKCNYQSPTQKMMNLLDNSEVESHNNPGSTTSDQTEYRGRSADKYVRRSHSLLEPRDGADRFDRRSPRRSVSLFDDEDQSLPPLPLPRHVMSLGRKYRDGVKSNPGTTRRDNFHNYKNDKIQEESWDDSSRTPNIKIEQASDSGERGVANTEHNACESLRSNSQQSSPNFLDRSSMSVKSCDTSPNESTSNGFDFNYSYNKSDSSKDFENRLLAAENLIKESKLKNLGPSSIDMNLNSSYRDTDKCSKESLAAISEGSTVERRRSYIPSLRMRSSSLTREPMESKGRSKSFTGSQDILGTRAGTPERSILSKFFKSGSSKDAEGSKERQQKGSGQRRISRFLRPDFFDTPREESQYVKEKEAQKAAENERRKSRFSKKKSEGKDSKVVEERPPKDLKNEANSITKDKSENSSKDEKSDKDVASSSEEAKPKFERQPMKNSFLHSLEKKLERFRMSDEVSKSSINNGNLIEQKLRSLRENSAPPEECLSTESGLIKRAVSVEDLSLNEANVSLSKTKVNSVLGLFKNNEPKSNATGSRPQIFSKLRKSSYKGSRSDTTCDADAASTSSKIPTKLTKLDSKLSKRKIKDSKISATTKDEDDSSGSKEPVKDVAKKSPDRLPEATKRLSPAKSSKSSPEKIVDKKTESSDNEKTAKSTSTEKSIAGTATTCQQNGSSSEKSTESSGGTSGKKIDSGRKSSLTTLRNGSLKKTEKGSENEKKMEKSAGSKETVEKESGSCDGTKKKKKIVRVVKKVVKKSSTDSSESKSEPKEKSLKTLTKKVISLSKEKSNEGQLSNGGVGKSQEKNAKVKQSDNNVVKSFGRQIKASTSNNSANETSTEGDLPKSSTSTSGENSSQAPDSKSTSESTSNHGNNLVSDRSDLIAEPKPVESRVTPNRNSLKLDLSKIPQHTFRNAHSTRKDTIRSDSQKIDSIDMDIPKLSKNHAASKSPDDAKKLIQNLAKITHNANASGNKISSIDDATGSAELRKDWKESDEASEMGKSAPSRDEAAAVASVATNDVGEIKNSDFKMQEQEASKKNLNLNLPVFDPNPIPPPKESPGDAPDEILSPMDDTESFDSWSICSADMNHSRSDLQSPTSPAHSPTSRGDQPESVVDRIRRRSFYSRFNDRKRKPSLNAPPPGVTLPVSSTLPRKFSFNRTREKEHDKLASFVSPARRYTERSTYSLYNDEHQPYRRSPIDRDRFSDTGIASSSYYSSGLRSPSELYGTSLGSPYDPLRKYTRSPTFETSNIRRKYASSDYGIDDSSSYRSPLSSTSLLTDHHPLDSHSLRSFNTLPKKYLSTITNSEPKTADYYEELLTPSNNADYLSSRTPTSSGDTSSCENGYHNGNLDTPHQCKKAEKWKNLTDKMAGLNSTDLNNGRLAEQMRDNSQQDAEEPKEMPSTTSESQPSTSAK